MRFSRKTDYGVILMSSIAPTYRSKEFISLSVIAKQNRISLVFLQKLADILRRAGFLEARRGKQGGYRALRDPRKTSLQDLIETLEESFLMRCMYSQHPAKYCPLVKFCPTRKSWLKVEEKVNRIFQDTTLDQLAS